MSFKQIFYGNMILFKTLLILPPTPANFIVRIQINMGISDRVKMDYKPRDRVRPLFYQQKPKRSKLKLLGILGFIAISWSSYTAWQHYTANPIPVDEGNVSAEITLPTVAVEAKQAQKEAIAPIIEAEWKTLKVEHGDSLGKLFNKAGLSAAELHAALSIGDHADYLKKIYPGQTIRLLTDADGGLLGLEQEIDKFKTLQIERQGNQLISSLVEAPVENRIAYGRATIQSSLFLDGKRANLEDKLIMELADIFAYDIDFALDIRPNDSFKVLYEEQYLEGEKIGVGSILSAEFVNQGKTYKAVRFADEKGKPAFYTPEGKSLKKAFIRTPVKYTRISSHFNLQRKHPVLHTIRAHRGVDYAAPRGTPVKASGAGKVEFIGRKGGYGNTIILQHGKKFTTLYAHLSRFNNKLKNGSKVEQGDVIGYVGSSGLATGPHLHYEFRINGQHRNPLTVALPKSKDIINTQKDEFFIHSKNLLALMEHHDRVMLAQTELE